jgi:hypothetical protein
MAKRTELCLAENKKRSELANSRRAIPGELSEILHARKAMSYGGCAIADAKKPANPKMTRKNEIDRRLSRIDGAATRWQPALLGLNRVSLGTDERNTRRFGCHCVPLFVAKFLPGTYFRINFPNLSIIPNNL